MFHRFYPKVSGAVAGTIGLASFIGWFAHATALIQIIPNQPAIACNTAFGFILCGAALFYLNANGARISCGLGGLVAALGGLTLVEYLAGLDFGIDQFFIKPYIQIGTAFPGRMAPLTALCFLSFGSAILLIGWRRSAAVFKAVAVLMVFVGMVACVTLFGYMADINAATGWGLYSRMAPNTAAEFLLLGTGLLAWTWRTGQEADIHFSGWLPAVASATLMIMIAAVSTTCFSQLAESEALRQQSYEVLGKALALLDDSLAVQRGMHDYEIAGQPAALLTYQTGVDDARKQVAQIMALTADNPARQEHLKPLSADLDAVVAYSQKLMADRQAHRMNPVIKGDATGEGFAANSRLLGDLRGFTDAERQTLIDRSTRAETDFHNIKKLLGSASAVAGVLLVLANLMTSRAMARQQELAERARAAEKAKSEFLAIMSHEIRTPLNGVIGMTSILVEMELSDLARECVRTVKTSGESLLMVINDVLDFSKIESGRMRLEDRAFDLSQCVEEAVDLFAAQIRGKKIEAAYLVANDIPSHLVGDAMRLRQVLMNLIGNAIKFTTRGEITVNVDCQKQDETGYHLRFSVSDTGVGMTRQQIDRLFKAFEQADTSTTRRFGGTGLGLVISKRLIELMGGNIWVESEPDKGSTFLFDITLKAARETVPENQPPTAGAMPSQTALIVDDNATNRRILEIQLKMWGLKPVAVPDGAEALRLLAEREFDVALIDFQMPGLDGIALGREIRQRTPMPLILLSSFGEIIGGNDARLFQAQIPKPIRHSDLFNALLQATGMAAIPQPKPVGAGFDQSMAGRHPLRILLTEDNAVNQRVCLLMLSQFGYGAEVAASGAEALQKVATAGFDLILMDIQMPGMSGTEASRLIREKLGTSCPVIAAVTAEALEGDRQKFLSQGFDAYLSKPLEIGVVQELLKTIVARKYPQPPAIGLAATPETAPPAPNLPDIASLRNLVNDDDELAELVELFATSTTATMAELHRASEAANASELYRAAHTLKGACGNFGAASLYQLCGRIEQAGRSGQLNEAAELVTLAEKELVAYTESLKPYRRQNTRK